MWNVTGYGLLIASGETFDNALEKAYILAKNHCQSIGEDFLDLEVSWNDSNTKALVALPNSSPIDGWPQIILIEKERF